MDTIDWTIFTKKIKINSSLEKIYQHWTTPELLCIWFLKEAIYTDSTGKIRSQTAQFKTVDLYIRKWHNYDGEEKRAIK